MKLIQELLLLRKQNSCLVVNIFSHHTEKFKKPNHNHLGKCLGWEIPNTKNQDEVDTACLLAGIAGDVCWCSCQDGAGPFAVLQNVGTELQGWAGRDRSCHSFDSQLDRLSTFQVAELSFLHFSFTNASLWFCHFLSIKLLGFIHAPSKVPSIKLCFFLPFLTCNWRRSPSERLVQKPVECPVQ